MTSVETRDLLYQVFGEHAVLSEGVSCLTYYGEGDHLGPHLDMPAEECSVTIIIYLEATSPAPDAPDTGLILRVYGEDMAAGDEARLTIPTHAGSIVVGRGSKVWHERPKLKTGEWVAAVTGCFARVAEGRTAD